MEQYGAIKEQLFYAGFSCIKLLEICFWVKIINFTFFFNILKNNNFKRGAIVDFEGSIQEQSFEL